MYNVEYVLEKYIGDFYLKLAYDKQSRVRVDKEWSPWVISTHSACRSRTTTGARRRYKGNNMQTISRQERSVGST